MQYFGLRFTFSPVSRQKLASRQGFTDARRGLWPSRQFRWEVPPAAGYNTYGGVGPAPKNTPRTSLLDQVAAALRRALLAAGLLRFLARAQLRTPILGRLLARLPRDHALADGGAFGRVDHVLVPGGQYAADLLFGLLDARGIHWVGRKDASDLTGLFPLQLPQLLEDADGAVGIVAGGVEILHAQVIGLRFILAREVRKRRGDADASALADDRAANAAAQKDCHGDARQVDDLGFGGLFGHVARRHMRDLVGPRRRQFVLFVGDLDERRVDEDITAGQREGVRRIALDHLKGERDLGIGAANQILADAVDVFGDQRVIHHLSLTGDFLRQLLAQRHLFFSE